MNQFAELYVVAYRWPEDKGQWKFGFIIHTNMESEKACEACGISDNFVLIYTPSIDPQEIANNFDGLEIEIIKQE